MIDCRMIKLWFGASSLNSCIATKGLKYSPLPKVKKCNLWLSVYLPVNLNAASSSEFTTYKFMFVVWRLRLGKVATHFGQQTASIFHVNCIFKNWKHEGVFHDLTFCSQDTISRNYCGSCLFLSYSFKVKMRPGDIVLRIKELLFLTGQKSNIKFLSI